MIIIQIEILNAKQVTKPGKKEGTTYQMLDVAFKNLSFNGKVEGKAVMSFGPQGDTFKVLSVSKPGDIYDITVTKNAGGYNDWVAAKKADGVTAVESASVSATPAYTPAPRNTYETPEERAKKQIYIIRQSSISSAIAALSVNPGKDKIQVEDVLKVAETFENHVFGTKDTTLVTGHFSIAEIEDSVI